MYCRHCGKEIEENMKFCPYCGGNTEEFQKKNNDNEQIKNMPQKIPENIAKKESNNVATRTLPSKLVFYKSKGWGYGVYKWVQTEVEIKTDKLHIHQEILKYFIIKRQKEEIIPLSNISSAFIQTKMDFWDTFDAVILMIIGFFYTPIAFLFAVYCLYRGYGKVITLKMSNGSKFQIPLKGNMEDAEKLINYCR